MSFCIGPLVIAEPRVTGVTGVPGIGFSRLQFSLALDIGARSGCVVELGNLSGRVDAGVSRSGPFKLLGTLTPETSWSTSTTEYSRTDHLGLSLDLPPEQLEALEHLRGGGSLFFQIDLRLQLRENGKSHPGFDKHLFESNLSNWSKVLQQLGYLEYLVVAVELPIDAPAELRSAIEQLGAAHQDLIGGRYDSVVSRCRMAMDALDKAVPSENGAEKLIEVFSQGRKAMSKRARADLVRLAVRHYTHLAHHVDSDGSPESFSRQDALFILTAAAGAIWDAAAELRRRN